MKIETAWPPNIAAIRSVFPLPRGVIFTYGNVIYNPYGGKISRELKAHEAVHCKQQGDDIEGWWEKYLVDDEFRFDQELEAHRAEYRAFCKHAKNKNNRAAFLNRVATRLASEMYGGLVTRTEARTQILNY